MFVCVSLSLSNKKNFKDIYEQKRVGHICTPLGIQYNVLILVGAKKGLCGKQIENMQIGLSGQTIH